MASVCVQRLALQPSHVQHAPHRLSLLVSTFLPSVITWMVPPFDQNNTCDVCMLLNARTISHLPHHVPCCVARWFPPLFGTPSPPSCQGTMQTSSPPTLLVTLSQCPLLLFLYCPASRCWSSPGIRRQVSSFLQTHFLNEIITPA